MTQTISQALNQEALAGSVTSLRCNLEQCFRYIFVGDFLDTFFGYICLWTKQKSSDVIVRHALFSWWLGFSEFNEPPFMELWTCWNCLKVLEKCAYTHRFTTLENYFRLANFYSFWYIFFYVCVFLLLLLIGKRKFYWLITHFFFKFWIFERN